MARPRKWFYAVFNGRRPGIYETWTGQDGAQVQIAGFPGAIYKKFGTEEEALQWTADLKNAPSEKKTAKPADGDAREQNEKKNSAYREKPGIKKPLNAENLPEVVMYTDGACTNNPGPGGYGVVLLHGGRKKELSGGFRRTTNNRMEITACVEGLQVLKKPCAVALFCDSRYVVDALEKGWAKRWKAKGWKRNNTDKALNPDLWERMLSLCEKHDVAFNWVKGHAGDEYNERCDRLAVEAASKPNLPPDEPYERYEREIQTGASNGESHSDESPPDSSLAADCPECGARMVLRKGKFGKFYGCSRFPECRGVCSIKAKSQS